MKKSSIIILTGILCALLTLAAANLKLKKEYVKKNIKEYLLYKDLAPFHYIKDAYTGKQTYEWYTCTVKQSNKYGVGIGFAADKLIRFTVKNDTLFIQKPLESSINDIVYGLPVTLFCGPLKSVSTQIGIITITGKMADSLTATAINKSEIKFQQLKTRHLQVNTDNTANVSVSATDSIPVLHLRLKANSVFIANNVLIGERVLDIDDSASLRLSGISLANFGIRHNR